MKCTSLLLCGRRPLRPADSRILLRYVGPALAITFAHDWRSNGSAVVGGGERRRLIDHGLSGRRGRFRCTNRYMVATLFSATINKRQTC